jgi:hypothetical protein
MMNQARAARTRSSPIVDSTACRGTLPTAWGWQAVARSSQRQVHSELEQARRSAMVAFSARAARAHEAMATLANDPALLQAMAAGDRDRVQRCSAPSAAPTSSWP